MTLAFMIKVRNEKLIKAFGARVRKLRKERKISMEELAYRANVDYSQIGNIERGEINTTISSAYALAKALDMSFEDLFKFEFNEDKNGNP